MRATRTKTSKPKHYDRTPPAVQAQLAALPEAAEGRRYVLVAPFCWGKGKTAQQAEAYARQNRARSYEPARGWCWILFDAPANTEIHDVDGSLSWQLPEGVERNSSEAQAIAARQVLSFNMPAVDADQDK